MRIYQKISRNYKKPLEDILLMTENVEPIDELNQLIFIITDAKKGYQKAAEQIDDPPLKGLLMSLTEQRDILMSQLEKAREQRDAVEERHREHVEGEVPRGVPRVLPLVRHRDDVEVVEVPPFAVAPALAALGRWVDRVAFEPLFDVVVVKLLGPQHSGECLALHAALLFGEGVSGDPTSLARRGDGASAHLSLWERSDLRQQIRVRASGAGHQLRS